MRAVFGIVIFILVSVLIIGGISMGEFNDHEYTITITDKERIVEGGGKSTSSKYLIFGKDENGEVLVLENSDSVLRRKFNSSTIQGSLEEGKTYDVVVVGYRIPFLSSYENIISYEEKGGE